MKKLILYRAILRKFVLITLASIAFIAIIVSSSTILLITTGSKSIYYIGELGSKIISNYLEDTQISINDLILSWDKINYEYHIEIINAELVYNRSDKIAIPKIKFEINPIKIIKYGVSQIIQTLAISPNIEITEINNSERYNSNKDKKISTTHIYNYIKKHIDLIIALGEKLTNLHFKILLEKNRSLNIIINKIVIDPIRNKEDILLNFYTEIAVEDEILTTTFSLDTSNSDLFVIKGEITKLTPRLISKFFSLSPIFSDKIPGVNLAFSLETQNLSNIDKITFHNFNYQNHADKSDILEPGIALDNLIISGSCSNNCGNITIDKLYLKVNNLLLHGTINKTPDGILKSNIKIDKIAIEEIYDYWPNLIAPDLREWLKTNLKSGHIRQSDIKLNLNLTDIAQDIPIPEDAISVIILLENTNLSYMNDNVPPLNIEEAILSSTSNDIKIDIKKGKILNCNFISLTGNIKDFNAANTGILINANLKGTLNDTIALAEAHTKIKSNYLKNFNGDIISKIEFYVPFKDEVNLDDLNLIITAESLNNLSAKLLDSYLLNKGKFKAILENNILNIHGNCILNDNLKLNVDIKRQLEKVATENYISQVIITTSTTAERINKAKFSFPNYIHNNIFIKLHITEFIDNTRYNTVFDFKDSNIYFSLLGIKKKIGEQGTLNFDIVDDNDTELRITNYTLNLPGITSKGIGSIDKNSKTIKYLSSKDAHIFQDALTFNYNNDHGIKNLHLIADNLDLSNANLADINLLEHTTNSYKRFTVTTDLDRIVMKNGLIINKPKINISYKNSTCEEFKLEGYFDNDEYLRIFYSYPILSIVSNVAYKSLSAFNIYNNMNSGILEFKGKFTQDRHLDGELYITNYYIQNAPLLTKLLAISAITSTAFRGVADLLNGKGISFHELYCPLSYDNGIIQSNSCNIKGPVVGITSSGTIDIKTKQLKAAGFIIPVNIINSIVPKIPLFGSMITGGKEHPFIATNFKMFGNLQDEIKINVNPLSIFTPGIIGEIFGGIKNKALE